MKLLFILILTVLINVINSQVITVVPYSTSCSDAESVGIGYQLPLSQCITIGDNSVYLVLSNDSKYVKTYWVNNCTSPDFKEAMVFNYQVGSCSKFTIPFTDGLLSSITLNGQIPDNAVTYNYYYADPYLCEGANYQLFYTNNYSFNNQNQGLDKYTCKNNEPYLYTCNYNGQCETVNLGNSCSKDYENPYPYIVTC